MNTTVSIKNYSGNVMETKAIAFWAETDQNGEVFYKAELQGYNSKAALFMNYDLETALAMAGKVVRELLTEESEKLKQIITEGEKR